MFSKKIVALITTLAFVALTSIAFAADTMDVSVTSEPIQKDSTCDKAGGFSLEADTNTQVVDLDRITMDLDLGTSLCRDINLQISRGGSNTEWFAASGVGAQGDQDATGNLYSNAVAGDTNTTAAVYMVEDDTFTAGNATNGTWGGVYFMLRGTAGTQRTTLTAIGDNGTTADNGTSDPNSFIQVGPDGGDKLVITFLDQDTADIWTADDADGIYNDQGEVADNTLCINVLGYPDNTVDMNMDSTPGDKFTFIPSDPQVAHIVSASSLTLVSCKNAAGCQIETTVGDQANCFFDPDSISTADMWCSTCPTATNRLVVRIQPELPVLGSDEGGYDVRLEILVDGATGANGVYWMEPLATDAISANTSSVCTADLTEDFYNDTDVPLLANGATGTYPTSSTCTPDDTRKVVTIETVDESFTVNSGDQYVAIELPNMLVDTAAVTSGQTISVRLTIIRRPCGTITFPAKTIATIGCDASTNTLFFPYVTEYAAGVDSYNDGFVLVNRSTTSGDYTLTVREMDGDVATYTNSLASGEMFVTLLETIVGDMTLVNSVDGTLGNSRAWIGVSANFAIDGFFFIYAPTDGTSMGYLPRSSTGGPSASYPAP